MRTQFLRYTCVLAGVAALGIPSFAQIRNDDGSIATAQPPFHFRVKPNGSTPTGIFPAQMKKAYGIDQVANQGAGVTIGIVDAYDAPTIESDLGVFNTQFSLPACTTGNGCFQKVYASGSQPAVNAGWAVEASLDVEWAHAIAPQAKIILVEAASASFSDLLAGVDAAVAHGATVVTMSFGGSEFSSETGEDSHFNVPGVAFFASSGDNGHGAQYPAASPFVIGVGGTSLTIQNDGTYVSESAWSGSGGGTSKYETKPTYQNGIPVIRNRRSVPDVAFDADPNTGVPVYDSTADGQYVNWTQVGGTSLSSPMWAGVMAIADSSRAGVQKSVLDSSVLSSIYGSLFADLNDIASGTNGGCPKACKSVPGYDQVTGLGTPIVNLLIPALVALP